MKKLLLIIVVLAAVGYWYHVHQKNAANPPVVVAPAVAHPDPSNATFSFDDGPITLEKGTASTDVTPNGAITMETDLTNDIAYGNLNADGKTDTAGLLVQSGTGSGVFLYVAAYVSGVVQYKGTNAIFIGDRVTPKSISVDKDVITVTYLDRGPSEPMADEPSILKTARYSYTDGALSAI